MFKKDLSPGAKSKVKSSVQRALRAKILETYPKLNSHIDEILPKKEQLDLVKLYVRSYTPSHPALHSVCRVSDMLGRLANPGIDLWAQTRPDLPLRPRRPTPLLAAHGRPADTSFEAGAPVSRVLEYDWD